MKNITCIDYLKAQGKLWINRQLGPATNSAVVLRSATTNRTYPNERESVITTDKS